jgi:hypothetical protein
LAHSLKQPVTSPKTCPTSTTSSPATCSAKCRTGRRASGTWRSCVIWASVMADACPCVLLDVGSTRALAELHSEPSTRPHLPSLCLAALARARARHSVRGHHCRSAELRGRPPPSILSPNQTTAPPSSPRVAPPAPLPWPMSPPEHSQPRRRSCCQSALVVPPPPSMPCHAACTGGCAWGPWCRTAYPRRQNRPCRQAKPHRRLLCSPEE